MKPAHIHVTPEFKSTLLQFYEDYAETLDNQDLEGWPAYFTEDCKYLVIARENYDAGLPHATIYCEGLGMVKDRARATRDCTVYEPRYLRHFIHGLRVTELADSTVKAKATFLLVESVSDKAPYIHMVGQYLDTLVIGPEGLRLKERICAYDNYRIYNSLVFPV